MTSPLENGQHQTFPTTCQFRQRPRTTIEADLNIVEVPYESGAIRFRYARYLAPDGARWIRHGLFVAYHENGVVSSEGRYFDGKETGVWRDFHVSGQMASEGNYHEGLEVGTWRFWTPDGSEQPPTQHNH